MRYGFVSAASRSILTMSVPVPPGLNSYALKAGDPYPAYDGKLIRIYNMRFCPYAQRALIAFGAKGIPFEVVNVNLREKPQWFLDRNPIGKVPTVELPDGRIMYESLVVSQWADEAFPDQGVKLLPSDPFHKAQQQMIVELLGKVGSALYGVMLKGDDVAKIHDAVRNAEKLMPGDYYGGAEPGWADYMQWSFFERLRALSDNELATFSLDKHPQFSAYWDRMMKIPVIKAFARPSEHHKAYFKSYVAKNNDFDYGIEKSRQ